MPIKTKKLMDESLVQKLKCQKIHQIRVFTQIPALIIFSMMLTACQVVQDLSLLSKNLTRLMRIAISIQCKRARPYLH